MSKATKFTLISSSKGKILLRYITNLDKSVIIPIKDILAYQKLKNRYKTYCICSLFNSCVISIFLFVRR